MRDLVLDRDGALAVRDLGGSGPAVLLLHGATRNLEDLMAVAERLLPAYRVVAMDFRNHGWSAHGEWDWPDLVADVTAVIERLELEDVVVVGHSLGGMVAALCAQVPGLVRAAVNLDGHGPGTTDLYDGMAPERVRELWRRGRELAHTVLPGPMTPAELEQLCSAAGTAAEAQGMDAEHLVKTLRRSFSPDQSGRLVFSPTASEHQQTLDRVDELDLLGVYRKATCPLLVVRATALPPDDAPPWFVELARAQQAGLRRELDTLNASSPLVTVTYVDADHGLIGTHPQLVADLVREHVSGT